MSKSEADSNITMRDMKIFNEIRNYIRKKINNSSGNYFEMWPNKNEFIDLIRRSVTASESNSVIVCGPPGCGKTAFVENAIEELKKDNIINERSTSIIKLNGLLHTDDKLALQDITRQLKLFDGSEFQSSSFQENLIFLLEKLKEKMVEGNDQPYFIFLLDEFHLFCTHKNQILLYNLFDIVQSAKSPIFVIGITYTIDVMDLLEKRVLSRFSHRIVWLNQKVTIEERLKMFKNIFTLVHDDLPNVDEIYKVLWNMRIDELLKSQEVIETLKHQLEEDPSQTKFRNLMFKLFNTVTFELPLLTADNIKNVFATPDFYFSILSGLSLLEMALLIAIKHHNINYEREPFNFEMIFSKYLKFCRKTSTTLVTERSVVLKAFQRLQELEIVIPVKKVFGNSIGKVPLEYQLYNFNLTDEQVNEGVKLNSELTTELRQWATTVV